MCLKQEDSLPIMPPEAKVLIALLRKFRKSKCFRTAKNESYFCFCHSLLMGMDKSHLNPLILFLYLQIELCISLNHMKLLFGHVLLNKKFTVLLRESVNKPTTSGRTRLCNWLSFLFGHEPSKPCRHSSSTCSFQKIKKYLIIMN